MRRAECASFDEWASSLMTGALDVAKKMRSAHKDVPGVAFVLFEDGEIEGPLPFYWNNPREKEARGKALAMAAGLFGAHAVMVVNDVRMRMIDCQGEADKERIVSEYRQGDLAKDSRAIDALMVAIKGPTIAPRGIVQPYTFTNNSPVYHQTMTLGSEDKNANDGLVEFNIVPDWWKKSQPAKEGM